METVTTLSRISMQSVRSSSRRPITAQPLQIGSFAIHEGKYIHGGKEKLVRFAHLTQRTLFLHPLI